MLLILLCLPINAAAEQNDSSALLVQGDQYGAEGKLIQARDAYERAIAAGAALKKDPVRSNRLGLWYMNGEPHDFGKASEWFEAALLLNPDDDDIRLHLAQVLSWNGQYGPAIARYRELVRKKPGDRALKLQLARVLSWSRNFPEALSIYDQLQSASPNDIEVLIERARVLSWSRRFDEASRAYSEVLKHDPTNREAKVGQAQVLYWSGNAEAARSLVKEVLEQEPSNAQASYLMAALDHNLGQNADALQWLKNASPDKDTDELKNLILREMRPVLHLRFGFGNDREEPTAGKDSTYRTLRYMGTLGFNLTNNVRMEVANTVTQNSTSTAILAKLGPDSLATQTVARLHFSIARWLRMSAGAGDGTAGVGELEGVVAPRRHHLLYEIHPAILHGGMRIDLSSVRSISDYTPLSVHLNLVQRRESVAASYTFGKRVRIGGEYWHGDYKGEIPGGSGFRTQAQGGAASFYPILYTSERFFVEAGVRYELFEFADKTAEILDPEHGFESIGIFTPRLFQRYSGTARLSWRAHKLLRIELDGTYGPQRIFGFESLNPPPADFGETGSFGFQLTVPSPRLEPYVAGNLFSTATPASPGLQQGSFSSISLIAGLRIRF